MADSIKTADILLPALPIALGAEVLLEIVNLNQRMKCVLVGMEFGQYLIIRLSPNDLLGTFRSDSVKDSPVILRYLHQKTVYGFNTAILNIVTAPAKIIFLSYPKKIEESKALVTTRHECSIPGMTMFGNEFVDLTIVDISKEGCRLVIKTSPKKERLYGLIQVNKNIEIMAEPGANGKLTLHGKIRNVSKDVDSITVGVQFDEMGSEAQARLANLISAIN
ncbi:MAG: PilZ domain-containing protein [Deltaproteobacteria bacterium]|nr:PilZ domain-containing protein [Deltaproteobacteria bacterium]